MAQSCIMVAHAWKGLCYMKPRPARGALRRRAHTFALATSPAALSVPFAHMILPQVRRATSAQPHLQKRAGAQVRSVARQLPLLHVPAIPAPAALLCAHINFSENALDSPFVTFLFLQPSPSQLAAACLQRLLKRSMRIRSDRTVWAVMTVTEALCADGTCCLLITEPTAEPQLRIGF